MLFVSGLLARDNILTNPGPKEPICGFRKNANYFEEGQIKQGLSVDLQISRAQLNEPILLRFFVNRKPGDIPIDKLQLEHEKYMHVIGIRDDLNEFFHIHPVRVAPGVWEVNHVFTNAGNYKIWSQIRHLDASYSIGHPLVTVPGAIRNTDNDREVKDHVVSSGYQITFKHSEPLIAGRASDLEFLIRDAAGREIATENFLGAPMHLVIVPDNLSICLHAHPDVQSGADPMIHFTELFPREGVYKLFAQFRPRDTKLPADDAILAAFYVRVVKSPVTAAAIIPTKN